MLATHQVGSSVALRFPFRQKTETAEALFAQVQADPVDGCKNLEKAVVAEPEYDVIVRLRGGLGNQLFQYAFGMALTLKHRRKVAFDDSYYRREGIRDHEVNFIGGLALPKKLSNPPEKSIRIARSLKKFPYNLQKSLSGMAYIREKPPKLLEVVRLPDYKIYLYGGWQNWRYFEGIETEVRSTIRNAIEAAVECGTSELENVVGVHVRRGDYLNHKPAEKLDYRRLVERALPCIEGLATSPIAEIVIFSDDPDWCENEFSHLPKVRVMPQGDDLQDFARLMMCQHKIIANSTFSWWAAFLGEREDGVVVAPQRWHRTVRSRFADLVEGRGWIAVGD